MSKDLVRLSMDENSLMGLSSARCTAQRHTSVMGFRVLRRKAMKKGALPARIWQQVRGHRWTGSMGAVGGCEGWVR
eukprot:1009804-Rhodomonas_salina.5